MMPTASMDARLHYSLLYTGQMCLGPVATSFCFFPGIRWEVASSMSLPGIKDLMDNAGKGEIESQRDRGGFNESRVSLVIDSLCLQPSSF